MLKSKIFQTYLKTNKNPQWVKTSSFTSQLIKIQPQLSHQCTHLVHQIRSRGKPFDYECIPHHQSDTWNNCKLVNSPSEQKRDLMSEKPVRSVMKHYADWVKHCRYTETSVVSMKV